MPQGIFGTADFEPDKCSVMRHMTCISTLFYLVYSGIALGKEMHYNKNFDPQDSCSISLCFQAV